MASNDPTERAFDDRLRGRLKGLRAERNWSQQDIANNLLISKDRYAKWENRDPPSIYWLARIAQVYKITLDLLVFGKVLVPERASQPHTRLVRKRA